MATNVGVLRNPTNGAIFTFLYTFNVKERMIILHPTVSDILCLGIFLIDVQLALLFLVDGKG